MIMPIGDDNTGRTIRPWVTYALIAANVLVFFVFQGGGANEKFTYAFSCVPREIATGDDEVTPPKEVEYAGQSVTVPGLERTPGSVYLTLLAWRRRWRTCLRPSPFMGPTASKR
jgi:hypothetical protein